jgi:sulfatase modifying factor 1
MATSPSRLRSFVPVVLGVAGGIWACGAATGLDFAEGLASDAGSDGGSCTSSTSSGTLPPSCKPGGPGMSNCGADGRESCCTSLEVAGGTYYRTYANSGTGPTGESDPATVSTFRLDKYDVTVGRFRQFVNAWKDGAGYDPPTASGKHTCLNGGSGLANVGSPGTYEPGWIASDDTNVAPTGAQLAGGTWTPSPADRENRPIDDVNWWEAYAFCIWDGGFLPSEAEWEYAAAGGRQQREYPWGSHDPQRDTQYAIYDCNYPSDDDSGICPTNPGIAPVGVATLGSGPWGQLDLVGNVFNWTLDWYAPYANPCVDCADLTPATGRVLRGDSIGGLDLKMGSTFRSVSDPSWREDSLGFRCARNP